MVENLEVKQMISTKKFFLLLLVFILIGGVICYLILRFSKPDLLFEANQKIEKANFQEAVPLYLDLLKTDPENAPYHYNLGNLYFETKDYDSAKEHFLSALNANEKGLRKKTLFNLGNTAFCLQDLEGALAAYERALLLEKDDRAARLNHDFVKKIQTLLSQENIEGLKTLLKDSCFQPPEKQEQQQSENQDQQQEEQKQDQAQQEQETENQEQSEKQQDEHQQEAQTTPEQEASSQEEMAQKQSYEQTDKRATEQWLESLSDDPSRALEFLIRKKSVEKRGKFDKDW